jgi:hypothetical protein
VLFLFLGALTFGVGVDFLARFVLLLQQWDILLLLGLGLVSLVGVLATITLIIPVSEGNKRSTGVLLRADSLGSIRVSIQALDAMAKKAIAELTEVVDSHTRITDAGTGDAVSVHIRVNFSQDTNVPESTERLRAAVKDYVQAVSGINVVNVEIFVDTALQPRDHAGGGVS